MCEHKKEFDKKETICPFNSYDKRRAICANLGWKVYQYEGKLIEMYTKYKMSGNEIAEYINQNTPTFISITPRSIQRMVKKHTSTRTVKEAFNNAMDRGRVKWVYKEYKNRRIKLNLGVRQAILKRDGYKCVLCGNTAKRTILEVDHIKPICRGGTNDPDNLRTLCHGCNIGKRIDNKER